MDNLVAPEASHLSLVVGGALHVEDASHTENLEELLHVDSVAPSAIVQHIGFDKIESELARIGRSSIACLPRCHDLREAINSVPFSYHWASPPTEVLGSSLQECRQVFPSPSHPGALSVALAGRDAASAKEHQWNPDIRLQTCLTAPTAQPASKRIA